MRAIHECKRNPFSKLTISCSNGCLVLPFSMQPSINTNYSLSTKNLHHVCEALFLDSTKETEIDQTEKFHDYNKELYSDICIKSTSITLDAFIYSGTTNLSQDVSFISLEPFVILLTAKRKCHHSSPNVENLDQLKWYCFYHRKCLQPMKRCIKQSFKQTIELCSGSSTMGLNRPSN